MNTTRFITVIITLMALCYSSFASAEVYQWVDAKGETHFSDKPPKSSRTKAAKKPQTAKRKSQVSKRQHQAKRNTQAVKRKPKSQVKRQAKSTKRASLPAKRKVYRNKSAVKKTKPLYRTAKISQGKKTRQISRPVSKRAAKQIRHASRQAKPVLAGAAATSPAASMLLSSLDKTFYDIEKIAVQAPETERSQAKTVITNFNESLCRANRRHLVVLQEEGFQYYYDNEGELRVAWGVEGFYRQKERYLSAKEAAEKSKQLSFEIERYCDEPQDKAALAQTRREWIRSEYCDVSKVILTDLAHPFMRTPDAEIKKQQQEVERYCYDYPANKYRDDERYYPTSLQVERLQQQHFLYR